MTALRDLTTLELLILHRAVQDVSVQSLTDDGYTLREAIDARTVLRGIVLTALVDSRTSR